MNEQVDKLRSKVLKKYSESIGSWVLLEMFSYLERNTILLITWFIVFYKLASELLSFLFWEELILK